LTTEAADASACEAFSRAVSATDDERSPEDLAFDVSSDCDPVPVALHAPAASDKQSIQANDAGFMRFSSFIVATSAVQRLCPR
jgi:hypothetical protein